jgi:MFS family permease
MSIGSLVALPVVPYIADGLGRRWGIMIGCLIMILGVILQTISINLKMFIAARFFLGFGIAIAHGASPLLVTELVHPQHRATFTTIYNTTWYIGSFIAAWLTFGTNHISEYSLPYPTSWPFADMIAIRQQLVLACTLSGAGSSFSPPDVLRLVRP